MKKILFILLLFISCSKEKESQTLSTPQSNGVSGTWSGLLTSPPCISQTGCGSASFNGNISQTITDNGSSVIIKNVIGSYIPEPMTAPINNNVITLPYFDSPSQAFAIHSGTITINGNTAYLSATVLSIALNNQICCTYQATATLTKQ